jgi:nucleotide-binding universal stress UspA family protein
MIALKQVLVATDFSGASDAALVYGRELAHAFGAKLHVLHVMENVFLRPMVDNPHAIREAACRMLSECVTDADRDTGWARAVLETSDHPVDAIVAYAKKEAINLIVMGTEGRGAMAQLLVGSIAEHVVRVAPCPVLTVRHPEHEFVHADRDRGATSRSDFDRPRISCVHWVS